MEFAYFIANLVFFTLVLGVGGWVFKYILRQNSDLMDRLQEMVGQIHYHQVQNNTPTQSKNPFDNFEKFWESEEEEDERIAEQHIDPTLINDILNEQQLNY